MADLNVALIAFAGVLVGGYFNNFPAKDFRRFRDSQALAGALRATVGPEIKPLDCVPAAQGSRVAPAN